MSRPSPDTSALLCLSLCSPFTQREGARAGWLQREVNTSASFQGSQEVCPAPAETWGQAVLTTGSGAASEDRRRRQGYSVRKQGLRMTVSKRSNDSVRRGFLATYSICIHSYLFLVTSFLSSHISVAYFLFYQMHMGLCMSICFKTAMTLVLFRSVCVCVCVSWIQFC